MDINIDSAIRLLKEALNNIPPLTQLQHDNEKFKLWLDKVQNIIIAAFPREDLMTFVSTDIPIHIVDGFTSSTELNSYYRQRLKAYSTNIKKIIQKYEILGVEEKLTDKAPPSKKGQESPIEQRISLPTSTKNWEAINSEYDVSKRSFGKKINFVSDSHKREIIFRDVEHSYNLATLGFSKPAVIIAGGVIEELLRLYLKNKNIKPEKDDFNGYIKACEKHGLLKSAISRLSDSVRQFRNLVHLSAEKTKTYTISKATAKGAVASIFTIANDF